MPGKVELLLPGLFDLPQGQMGTAAGLPALAKILRFARARENFAFSVDAGVFKALQMLQSAREIAGLPVAAAFADEAAEVSCVLFEPVHLRADMQQAIALPIDRRQRDLDDLRSMLDDLVRALEGDFDCREIGGGVYLMRLHRLLPPSHYPHLLSVLGKPVNPHIEQGGANLAWYRLQTEIQMFLHQHGVNAQRQARGEPAINSLWFWGAGATPQLPGGKPTWFCDDALLAPFARHLGSNCNDLDAISDDDSDGDIVVIDLRLLQWLKTGANLDLSRLMADIDERILVPLLRRVRRRKMRMTLWTASERDYHLGAWSSKCFWRRAKADFGFAAADRTTGQG